MATRTPKMLTPKKPLHTSDGSEPDTGVITHPSHAHVSADNVARISGRRKRKRTEKSEKRA